MSNIQTQLQLRATLQNLVAEIMTNNNISATEMENALNYLMIQIKDAATAEYINWSIQDKNTALQQLQESLKETEEGTTEEE